MMLITVSYVQFDSYHQKWLIIAMLHMDIVRKMSLHFSHTLKILTYEHYGLMAHNLLLMLYTSPLYIMLVLSWRAWWEYWIVLWKGSNLKAYTSSFAASLWSCLCLPAWAPYVMPSQLCHLGYWHPQTFQRTYCRKGFQLRRTCAFEERKTYLSIELLLRFLSWEFLLTPVLLVKSWKHCFPTLDSRHIITYLCKISISHKFRRRQTHQFWFDLLHSETLEAESLSSDSFPCPNFPEASGLELGLIIVMHYVNDIDEIPIQSSS